MTTVDLRDTDLDSGHVAVLGHKILAAVSVVAGALQTMREGSLSAASEDLLTDEIDRCIEAIVESSHLLIRGGAR